VTRRAARPQSSKIAINFREESYASHVHTSVKQTDTRPDRIASRPMRRSLSGRPQGPCSEAPCAVLRSIAQTCNRRDVGSEELCQLNRTRGGVISLLGFRKQCRFRTLLQRSISSMEQASQARRPESDPLPAKMAATQRGSSSVSVGVREPSTYPPQRRKNPMSTMRDNSTRPLLYGGPSQQFSCAPSPWRSISDSEPESSGTGGASRSRVGGPSQHCPRGRDPPDRPGQSPREHRERCRVPPPLRRRTNTTWGFGTKGGRYSKAD
jgi:hypothetical protein